MIQLRDYQLTIFDKVCQAVQEGYKSILIVLPCRAGKTPIATFITDMIYKQQGGVLFYVHRKILVEQTSNTFSSNELPHGILSPQHPHTDLPLQIGTIGTVNNRLDKLNHPHVLISDEAHRDKAATREIVVKHFHNSILIGLTATPIRLSGESLGSIYDIMIQGPSVTELINDGWLCEYKLYCPPSQIDVSNIKKTAGDYNTKDLAAITNTAVVIGDGISHYKKLLLGKQIVGFCVDIKNCIDTAEAYTAAGIPAMALHSKLSNKHQKEVIKKFVNKQIAYITNVDMITEGYDCPGIEGVQIFRKTQSLALHIQICTRGMTPAPGKHICYILDHVGNTEMHGPVDMDFEWSLDSGKKKSPSLEELLTPMPLIKVCGDCWYTYGGGKPCCPLCGAETIKTPLKVHVVEAELVLQKTINNTVRELVGKNLTQGLTAKELVKRIHLFDANHIPETSEAYIKVLKRYHTVMAKTPGEIIAVAQRWGYTLYWCASRYLTVNRMVSQSAAYNVLRATCKQYKIELEKK